MEHCKTKLRHSETHPAKVGNESYKNKVGVEVRVTSGRLIKMSESGAG